MSARALNLLVFRAGRRCVSGADLKAGLLHSLDSLSSTPNGEHMLHALLRAGELECAIADADQARAIEAMPFAKLADSLADLLLSGPSPAFFAIKEAVSRVPVPERLELSRPEGFAYYALHPSAYARVLDHLPELPEDLVVIGIRSIGTTLSAVTAAAARLRGARVLRLTVRPAGHPYDRETRFTPEQMHAIRDALARDAAFLVVDEGPGLSGSSFLSVAEALERAGVPRERITLVCGHAPDPEALCSANAAQRWRRFHSVSAGQELQGPAEAGIFLGGGEWRKRLLKSSSEWPESWISMERLKYLSVSEPWRLFKFAGLGHYGTPIMEREQAVAGAGFGPAPRQESDGFISYPWLDGHPASARDLSAQVLTRLAEYCAFRVHAFPANGSDNAALQQMAEHNLDQMGLSLHVTLKLERPVIADGRMQPHEWIRTARGELFKTDSGSHGDDHFFPGPTDIAWDLAGAIVEWRMAPHQAMEFMERYRRASGDDAGGRIRDFVHAYAAFRWAYCTMAGNAMAGTPEQERLEHAAFRSVTGPPFAFVATTSTTTRFEGVLKTRGA
jgi:hypothetical protein